MVDFNSVPVASAVNDSDYLHITTSGGEHKRVLVSKLIEKTKAQTLSLAEANFLDRLTNGCYIAVFSNSNNGRTALKASEVSYIATNNYTPVGILVVNGNKHLVVSLTTMSKKWGSANSLINEGITDRMLAFGDFNGKEKTSAIISSSSYQNDGTDYAAGYCAAYSCLNDNGKGFAAGSWWLPSLGELLMISANQEKIGICLSLITGAHPLHAGWYISSTEFSDSHFWGLYMPDKYMYGEYDKTNTSLLVRPVTYFK